MKDRRKMQRFDLHARANIRPIEEEGAIPSVQLLTRDVSSAGAFVLTSAPLPKGVPVFVELFLPVKFPRILPTTQVRSKVEVRGRVVRAEESGMAIAFGRNFRFASR